MYVMRAARSDFSRDFTFSVRHSNINRHFVVLSILRSLAPFSTSLSQLRIAIHYFKKMRHDVPRCAKRSNTYNVLPCKDQSRRYQWDWRYRGYSESRGTLSRSKADWPAHKGTVLHRRHHLLALRFYTVPQVEWAGVNFIDIYNRYLLIHSISLLLCSRSFPTEVWPISSATPPPNCQGSIRCDSGATLRSICTRKFGF